MEKEGGLERQGKKMRRVGLKVEGEHISMKAHVTRSMVRLEETGPLHKGIFNSTLYCPVLNLI